VSMGPRKQVRHLVFVIVLHRKLFT